jgi:hypothetical protein
VRKEEKKDQREEREEKQGERERECSGTLRTHVSY